MYDVIIIGAGASGIAAALELKSMAPDSRVLMLEKNSSIGRKLKATGNGRCNITNTEYEGYAEVKDFLTRNGIAFRVYENGLVYPYSESASDVVLQLYDRLRELGVELRTDYEAGRLETCEEGFVIDGKLHARRVILATGGKAAPAYGTTGDGYRLARKLGHSITTLVPILTPVECEGDFSELSGIRVKGRVSLLEGEKELFSESGEIQFTRYGLSGICIFNMTRYMSYSRDESIRKFRIRLDLDTDGMLESFIRAKAGRGLRTVFRDALSEEIARQAGSDEPADLYEAARSLEFVPSGIKGWKEAQCTMGGVPMDELDEATAESRLVKGLYITGELADYDGPCGGYNLSNAWITGIRAGRAIADEAL